MHQKKNIVSESYFFIYIYWIDKVLKIIFPKTDTQIAISHISLRFSLNHNNYNIFVYTELRIMMFTCVDICYVYLNINVKDFRGKIYTECKTSLDRFKTTSRKKNHKTICF